VSGAADVDLTSGEANSAPLNPLAGFNEPGREGKRKRGTGRKGRGKYTSNTFLVTAFDGLSQ